MDTIIHDVQAFSLSSTPSSSNSSAANTVANTSTASSRRPSSATSISSAPSETAMPVRKPSINNHATNTPTTNKPTSSTSEETILDDATQGRTRALRRQALARKISAHLRTIPTSSDSNSSSGSSSSSGNDTDSRRDYIDALAAREPEIYTPALAAYFADHVDDIPDRPVDAKTQLRKRYDNYELITDRFGRTSRVDDRQTRLFHGWEWDDKSGSAAAAVASKPKSKSKHDPASVSSAANSDRGPMGEKHRGDPVTCSHCERKERKDELRKVAIRGLGRLLGRKSKADLSASSSSLSLASEKKSRKAVVEEEADHAEQVERVAGAVRVK